MLPEADAPALDALAEEIEVRLSALRVEAAEFLEGLIVDGTHDERASLESAEDAIEVATSLGVDTGAAEERLASIRRMLSVRVVWDQAVCFCMLPLRVSFKALLQQVAARFQVKVPSTLQLWWTEARRFTTATCIKLTDNDRHFGRQESYSDWMETWLGRNACNAVALQSVLVAWSCRLYIKVGKCEFFRSSK
eukprot:g32319.t2